MNTWYTVKVKYTKEQDDGTFKRVTEPYLVDSVSFTDAEARIYEEVGSYVRGEFMITGMSKTDYADIISYDDDGQWYKCRASYESLDADSGKSKKVTHNYLVMASSVKEAFDRMSESLKDMLVTVEISGITLSPIVDVLPYSGEIEAKEPEARTQVYAPVQDEESMDDEEFEEEEAGEDDDMDEDEASTHADSSFEDETER
jgi:hypothetical protein